MLGSDQRTLLNQAYRTPDGSKHAGYGTPTSCSTTGPEVINRLKGSNTLSTATARRPRGRAANRTGVTARGRRLPSSSQTRHRAGL
jgi:hypothetical protein